MKKGLVFFLFFVAGLVFAQTKNDKTHYFFSIAYGQNNEVYVSDIYEINIDNQDIYSKLAERYSKFQNYLVQKGNVSSLKDIQTGYEKNYYKKEQALAEQKTLIFTLEKQQFKPTMVEYTM
ncbi:hypothetical protein [Algoriella sp.]|uniref:hypothetical protein n=1 Tax=Algoriella sp. TaxID=1872434 RepID=UPI001B02368E|nr:hypothetical protein [Algoriella sp.]MBO6213719.1 hypothetical protein [Algoriella sp.]